jgi:hypothetical protein
MDKITYKSSSPSQHTPQSQHIVMESETTETEMSTAINHLPTVVLGDNTNDLVTEKLDQKERNDEVVRTFRGLPAPDD